MIVPIKEHLEQDGSDLLVGVGSTTNVSLSRHKMSRQAIQEMKEQAVGLPGFLNHDPDQVFGQIVEVRESNPDEYVPVFKMLSDHPNPSVIAARDKVNHWLDNDMQIGLSMGGVIKKAKIVETYDDNDNLIDYYLDIQSIKLLETSVTPIPAVWETRGTVKKQNVCYGPLCNQMINQAFKQEIGELKELKKMYELKEEVEETEIVQTKDNGEDNMEDKKLQKKIDTLSQGIEILLKEREERILKEEADKKAKEEQEKLDALKEEITKDMVKVDDIKQLFDEFLGEMRGDKGHIKQSDKGGEGVEEGEEEDDLFVGENIAGKVLSDPADQPAHSGGVTQRAMTSEELIASFE